MVFSDTVTNLGIVQQVRSLMRVDSTQWPTWKIVNSVNNYLDLVTGYMIGNDDKFNWDDTNHTKLPEGTTDLVSAQSDYSFLTDEQGNKILTLLKVTLINAAGTETPLTLVDRNDSDYDISSFGKTSGTPSQYDKINDNIIRLDTKPTATDASTYDLKFYFQRTPSYFVATDTTKEPGVPAILHRGFVISAAYDGALTLGLQNLQFLAVERQIEEKKMISYFQGRNKDAETVMSNKSFNFR